jgi:oxaloacetate decarboxylase alpha subunit
MVRYFHGHFYEPAAPVDPKVADRVLSLPRAAELRDLQPLSLDGARERFGAGISEEELLLRLTMPAEQVDAMIAARDHPAAAPLARPGRSPVVRLLGELAKRESLSYVRVEKGDDLVVWRRAA